jgi:protein-tyrosine phosphatase
VLALPQLTTLPNFRDVGGHDTLDGGRVSRGLLYRSTDLARLDPPGMAALERLGIRAVYDLRTEVERASNPDRVPPGTGHVVLDVLRDAPEDASPARLMALLSDPVAAEAALGDGRGLTIFEMKYREFVFLPSARAGFGTLFRSLAEPVNRPALIHCTTGKDRTGWAAAALLLFLGVPEDVVMDEFLASTTPLLAAFEPQFRQYAAAGGDPALLRQLIGVRPAYLHAALGEMRARFGTVDRYVTEGLGVDPRAQRALRAAFLEAG